jgi:hypothetical protein
LHLVGAWASGNRAVLGQVATEAKVNETTAIRRLLELLKIEGCIVTLDAMGCESKIAALMHARSAHYVLALKSNQETLASAVERRLSMLMPGAIGGRSPRWSKAPTRA